VLLTPRAACDFSLSPISWRCCDGPKQNRFVTGYWACLSSALS